MSVERRREARRRAVIRRRIAALGVLALLAVTGTLIASAFSGGGGTTRAATETTTGTTEPAPAVTTPVVPAAPDPAVAKMELTIAWVGDTVLASKYGTPPNAGRGSLTEVSPPLRSADLAFGNLEETLSALPDTKCGSSPNCFAFEAPPAFSRNLKAAGFDVMNVANNHGDDFGPAGQRSTERALRRVGIAWAGRPGVITIIRRKGVRVAFLGFAPYPWASRLEHIAVARRLVARAASKANLVVVAIHAGSEGSTATHVPHGTETFLGENRGDSRRFAHAVVDAGADLVVGSGPHVIRGVERYHARLIAYSAGNFTGYKNFGTGGTLSLSAIVRVTLRGDGGLVGGRWISLRLDGDALPHLDPTNASAHLVAQLSRQDFGGRAAAIGDDGTITP